MPDDLMDSIEPYNYAELKAFSTAYLPGYLADKYDVGMKESSMRADLRCKNSAAEVMRADIIGYDTVTETHRNIAIQRGKVHYAMLPVWLLKTTWQNKEYVFAMNGHTGKFVGNLPVSAGRYRAWFAGMTVLLGAILYFSGVGGFLWMAFAWVLS